MQQHATYAAAFARTRSPTVTVAGVLCDRYRLVRAIRRLRAQNPQDPNGAGVVGAMAGCHGSTVSRRLADGGVLASDPQGRAIEAALLKLLPGAANLGANYGASAAIAQRAARVAPQRAAAAAAAAQSPPSQSQPQSAQATPRRAAPTDTTPEGLLARLDRPIATVRAAIRDGTLDSVFGPRKALAVAHTFGALCSAGYDTEDALAAAWYVCVVAKETQDNRLHVTEPYVAEFGRAPTPPAQDAKALRDPDDTSRILHPVVPLLVTLLRAGENVWLYGPAGNGKSRAARDAARLLGREHVTFPCNRHTHTDDLLGGLELRGGDTSYREGPGPYAMQRGAVLIIEEPSSAAAGMLTVMHSMLEERELTVPAAAQSDGTPLVVKAADTFGVVACDNAEAGKDAGAYAERNYMDPAFLDRFVMIECGPLPLSAERQLMRERLAASLQGEE